MIKPTENQVKGLGLPVATGSLAKIFRLKKVIILFCSLVWLAFLQKSVGQVTDSGTAVPAYRNAAFAELGGNSGFGFSGNYELSFPLKSTINASLALRGGIGTFIPVIDGKWGAPVFIPLELNFFVGRQFLKPEAGLGLTIIAEERVKQVGVPREPAKKIAVSRLGIRFESLHSRFLAKASVSYWMFDAAEGIVFPDQLFSFPFFGATVGFRF